MFKTGIGYFLQLSFLLLSGCLLKAQSSSDGLSYQLASTHKIDVEQELSHPKVNVIHQDRLGFIWIGTDYGLNRYDGHQVQKFYLDQDELSSNRITHILEDAQGIFWLIEAKSYYETCLKVDHVSLWDPLKQQALSNNQIFPQGFPFEWKNVKHFFQSQEGQLYFYLKQKETWKYTKNGRFEQLKLPEDYFPIQANQKEGLWVQAGSQVMELATDESTSRSFEIPEGISCQLIVEGLQQGVHYKGHSVRQQPIPMATEPLGWYSALGDTLPPSIQSFLHGNRSVLEIDRKNQIYWVLDSHWRAYDRNGNLLFNPEESPMISRTLYVQDYLYDQEGTIWDNTSSHIILQKLELKLFERFLDYSKDNEPYKVRGIIVGERKMLVGTYHGNCLVDLSSGETELWSVQNDDMIRSTFFSSIPESDSTIWASNYILSKINTQNWTIVETIDLPDMSITGIDAKIWGSFKAKSGKLWMKKQAYLLYYDPRTMDTLKIFQQYNGYDELEKELIYHFYENEKGIWLATYKGLYLLDEEKGIVAQYAKGTKGKNYLPADRIHYIHPDTGSWFWLATADIGLVHWNYQTGEWNNLSRRKGLPSNNLYAILADSLNYFWISSEEGLIRLHPNRKTFDLFFEEQGLPINEFNRMAYARSKNGYFYFGGQQGIIRFKPEQFNPSSPLSPKLSTAKGLIYDGQGLVVRKIAANNQRKQKIYLKAHEKRIDLDFSLQDYFQSERHEYWYRNTKSKDDWIKLKGNQLSLGGLAYGKNKFRVRAIQANGKIADNVMVLTIFQQAPFFLRWWFILLLSLLLAYLVYFYTQWRTKKYQEQQKILEQEVARRMEQIQKNQVIIQSQAAALKALDVNFIDQIDQVIQHNLKKSDFSVEDLASIMGLSRSQLHRKMKAVLQETPSRRIRKLRLQRAKELLQNPSLTIAEIAFACGFQDANYFSRLFKQEFGISASEYREREIG